MQLKSGKKRMSRQEREFRARILEIIGKNPGEKLTDDQFEALRSLSTSINYEKEENRDNKTSTVSMSQMEKSRESCRKL